MNKERRALIDKALDTLGDLRSDVESIRDAEQDAYDNMPEGLQSSDRGERAQEAGDSLDNAISNLEEAFSELESATA